MSNEGNVLDKHDIDIPGQVNIDVENVEIRQVRHIHINILIILTLSRH